MRVLVCGDAMVDRYWFGEVPRISPEAPVPVVKMVRSEDRQGAAANVARNCEAMGAVCDRLFSPTREAVVKIRVIGRSQQMVRVDFDEPQEAVSEEMFMALMPQADIVLFSDYGKGALVNVRALITHAKVAGKTVLVDPKGHDYYRYQCADVVKPNKDEMKELVGGWGSEDELEDKAQGARRKYALGALLLTRAQEGMTLYTDAGAVSIGTEAREVFDVSGAGDTAIAALACAIGRGVTLERAARYANKAAGIACGHFGTAVVSEAEVFG